MLYGLAAPAQDFFQILLINQLITSLIGGQVSFKVIRRKVNDKVRFNEKCVNIFYNKQNSYRF